ncbi:hypothetical protein FOZ60_010680 [Perkinsus olseni]|uniref:C-CAP/cofactor C-like domain-containing protein n=1 Tax=Perkinsus olseni TaxID=32597 RepID=A0A7J6PBF8_PEROL|nr:hypothetical protein FOZ60_010680 [Perkinsus olseni]
MPTSNDVVRPDPKDFIFTSKFSDKLVRKRGDIRGYDFSIDGCESCEIYLFDHTSQVFIDDCKDCTIFVGPVGGSVFLRDCSRVRLMALCQQLRTRDCRECELLLQIPGHPIVESSQHMIFGPLEIPKELTKAFNELMAEAGLAVARNEWASVFDFSKGQEPFPSDEHWRVMNEGEMRSRGKLNWHEEARACLGICVVARDVAPPKDEPGIELEEIEIESADSVRSSVASVELTEERGLCQRLLAGERVEVQDVRDCFKMPLEQSDKHVEEFLVELKLVTDLSSGNSSTTGDHVRDTLLTFFFQSPEDVADHIRTTMVNPQSAATFKKLQELNIVKLFVTGESCSARIMPLIRSSEMAKHVAIRAMLADQCRLAEDAPETYRAGVKALTTKDDRDEAVKALNYRTTKLMDDFEEHYHDSTHVKSVVSKHAILFRRILLWGQVADPETVGYIFEAAASASEDSLQLLSAVLTIDGIEETPAYELHGMSSLVKVVLGTSLSLLPAVLDIVAKSVERAAEIYEAESRDIEPSIVEVDLGDLREFVKKSLDPLCIRNAAIEIVEVTRPGASGNLVVAKAALKVLPGSFAVHVEDGFLPYGGHPGEPATISLTPAADSRYSNRYILPVIRATSLELKGIEEMHVEREYMDGGARYKIFPPKAHKGGCYAAARLILGDGENDVNCVWHNQVRVPPESDATTLIQVATEKIDGRRWRESRFNTFHLNYEPNQLRPVSRSSHSRLCNGTC